METERDRKKEDVNREDEAHLLFTLLLLLYRLNQVVRGKDTQNKHSTAGKMVRGV